MVFIPAAPREGLRICPHYPASTPRPSLSSRSGWQRPSRANRRSERHDRRDGHRGWPPAARTVLLKGVDAHGFVFYTNKESRKGDELAANPRAALLFFWKSLQRQIRIEGTVEQVTDAEADAYYAIAARVSRLGAWASISRGHWRIGRSWKSGWRKWNAVSRTKYLDPSYWSGYRVLPERFEFWQDMPLPSA